MTVSLVHAVVTLLMRQCKKYNRV